MQVREAMSTDLVTCDIDESLQTVTGIMLTHNIGSVIISEDGTPAGIVTESDILQTAHATGNSLTAIPCYQAMSSPLITIQPDRTLRRATQQMHDESVKKLVVADGTEVRGIITSQDIVTAYPDLKSEIAALVRTDRQREVEVNPHRRGDDG